MPTATSDSQEVSVGIIPLMAGLTLGNLKLIWLCDMIKMKGYFALFCCTVFIYVSTGESK